ncbi:MAG: methionyl-tRNA formyltransferase, partial [Nitrospiraceae bacterium]
VLDLPPRGCVNVHASLLPKYRGAGPIQWAIIKGERETGITTMLMDEGMDTGAILLQERLAIHPDETAGELSARLAEVGGRLLVETIRRLKDGTVTPRAQDHTQATMAPLLKKEDGWITWNAEATEIVNRVRGLSPWPGAFTNAGDERWIIWRAAAKERLANAPGPSPVPGTIVEASKDGILVATGHGLLAILELQPANSRRMTAAQYVAGHSLSPGLVLAASGQPQNDER